MQRRVKQLTGSYEEWLVNSLTDKQEAAAFLQVAFEEFQRDNNMEALLLALRYVAETQGGLGRLAQRTHLNRESLYKTLSKNGHPRLETFGLLLKGLGFQFSVKCA